MRVLLAPAIALMSRLKYPQKFALISLLFALPLAFVMYLLISEINGRIRFSQAEISGNAYLRPLRNLLEHVPQARRLAYAYANGMVALRPALIIKQSEIDADLDALEANDKELGAGLKTTDKFNVLKENWRFLRTKTLSLETRVSDDLY
ncbi:MAG: response regulator, partial [Candidatus Binatia bacterium]